MRYQIIYILIGSITLIINIVLLIAYLRLNFSVLPKKAENSVPKESVFKNIEQNIIEPDENTADFDEDSFIS